ncbi:unnamed protein product, partial [Prorocentrum cordatum]
AGWERSTSSCSFSTLAPQAELAVPFIVVVGFVMLSLFSGVWVDHMNDMRLKEEKETQLQAIHEAEKANKTFQTIFGESDDSPMAVTNTIDEDEFAVLLTQPQYKEAAAVSEMNFTRSEARELFALWDREQDERLSWSEFREGLEEYREGLTVKKILVMKSQLKKLVHSLESGGEGGRKFLPLLRASPGVEHQLEQADARLRACEERMLAFEDQVTASLVPMGWLQPPASSAPLSEAPWGVQKWRTGLGAPWGPSAIPP